MRALIIEDEIPAANRLKSILASIDEAITILTVCDSVKSAVKWLKSNNAPDVIFMDIELSDGRSFEIFKQVNITTPVIFITAYDHFAIKAIKLNALDYLLKPIDKEELTEAIKKVKKTVNISSKADPDYTELQSSFEQFSNGKKPKKLIVYDNSGARFVEIERIVRLKADSNYTYIYLSGGQYIISSKTLKIYEDLLCELGFFRVSNTHMINLNHVEKYLKGLGGSVTMSDGETIEVSRPKKKELMELLALNK